MLSRFNGKNLKRGLNYLKRNGILSAYYKAVERLSRDEDEAGYTEKVIAAQLSENQINLQKNTRFNNEYLISILVPAYNPDEKSFLKLLESVCNQTYSKWELIIADAGDSPRTKELAMEYAAGHRIIYHHIDKNLGISGNTNEALKLANGEYIALLDHDDELTLDALYEVMTTINSKSVCSGNDEVHGSNTEDGSKRVKFIYSDEDKVDYDNIHYFDWHRKYDYDPVLLLTNNYICHLTVVDTELARRIGGFDPNMDGSQDYDFFLRCVEQIDENEIIHIPKVLYHWRSSLASTAENPQAKLYAYEAGKRAVTAHLKRSGIEAKVENTEHLGFFSIVLPKNDFKVAVMSLNKFGSLNQTAFESISEDCIMVLSDNLKPQKDYLDKMTSFVNLPNVGAATGKIIRNGRIESAGYDFNVNGGIEPCFKGMNSHFSGYLHRASIIRCVDAYDKGCVLLKKDALIWNGDGPILKDGYKCIYVPRAEFVRKD